MRVYRRRTKVSDTLVLRTSFEHHLANDQSFPSFPVRRVQDVSLTPDPHCIHACALVARYGTGGLQWPRRAPWQPLPLSGRIRERGSRMYRYGRNDGLVPRWWHRMGVSMAMALENGSYTVSLANNTENMAVFVLPLNISVTDTVSLEDLEASVDKSTLLLEDVTLPRNLVKASRDMAPTDQLLYVVQRNNAEELAALQAECEANPNNTWHIDHCDGSGGHSSRRLATEPMTVNLVVDEAGYYAFHMQHNAIEEFGMQVLDAEGQETMAAVAIVAVLSIVGILLLILRINVLTKVMDAMIALSAGALFGAAFLHVLPESIEFYSEYGQMDLTLSMMFTIGFVVAMVVEMALELWVSIVGGESHTHAHLPTSMRLSSPANALSEAAGKQSGTPETGDYNAENTPTLSRGKMTSVSTFSLKVDWHTIKPMAYIILLGDLFHNFVDGVLIATAFLACDDSLGVSVTVSAILHELPQEFADFIILVESGFTPFQAVLFNFLSALSAFIGAIVVLAAVPVTNETMGLLLAVGSGTLVYIAGTDLLPGVLRVKSVGQFVVNLLMFGIGVGALALTTLHHVHCNAD
ncbi:Zinc/iron permease [Phytophthora cactorum]|nr:Zinc/iron permease [Phytophthora cactorum]